MKDVTIHDLLLLEAEGGQVEIQHADDFADDSLGDLAERINDGHRGYK